MIRKVALLVLLFQGAACVGCIWTMVVSSFSSTFSLQELVQRNQSGNGLDCSSGGGGGAGISAGGGGAGGKHSSFHKGESCSCRISNAEQFDETKFIQVLKESVEKDLETSGAKIVDSKNPDASSFTIEYAQGDTTTGRITISGTRSPGNYNFQAQLEEKTDAK